MSGGLRIVPYSFSDWSFHKIFGDAPKEPILPLGRSIEGLPIVYQGSQNTCVECSIAWIQSWRDKVGLSWEWLAKISKAGQAGSSPAVVLDAAHNIGVAEDENGKNASLHKIPAYSYVKTDPWSIYQALTIGPVAMGFYDYQGIGPHMMVAYDVTVDGQWKLVNWRAPDIQAQEMIPLSIRPDEVISIHNVSANLDRSEVMLSDLTVLRDKIQVFFSKL